VENHGSISRCATDVVETPFFLGAVNLYNSVSRHERLPRTGITQKKRTSGIYGLAWEPYV
jgi:hypothetical protein